MDLKDVVVARTGTFVLERPGKGRGQQTDCKTINAAKRVLREHQKRHGSKAVCIARNGAIKRFAVQLANEALV